MKKYLLFISFIFLLMSFMADETMTKENGAIVINTTEIGKNVEGYQGPTPLKVYIKNNMVEKIEFLKSPETPKYYDRVKKFLQSKWDGLKVKEAREKRPVRRKLMWSLVPPTPLRPSSKTSASPSTTTSHINNSTYEKTDLYDDGSISHDCGERTGTAVPKGRERRYR